MTQKPESYPLKKALLHPFQSNHVNLLGIPRFLVDSMKALGVGNHLFNLLNPLLYNWLDTSIQAFYYYSTTYILG